VKSIAAGKATIVNVQSTEPGWRTDHPKAGAAAFHTAGATH